MVQPTVGAVIPGPVGLGCVSKLVESEARNSISVISASVPASGFLSLVSMVDEL